MVEPLRTEKKVKKGAANWTDLRREGNALGSFFRKGGRGIGDDKTGSVVARKVWTIWGEGGIRSMVQPKNEKGPSFWPKGKGAVFNQHREKKVNIPGGRVREKGDFESSGGLRFGLGFSPEERKNGRYSALGPKLGNEKGSPPKLFVHRKKGRCWGRWGKANGN